MRKQLSLQMMAFFFNPQEVGLHNLFSLSGEAFIPELRGLHIRPEFLILDWGPERLQKTFSLPTSSVQYFRLPKENSQLTLTVPDSVRSFKVFRIGQSDIWKIKKVLHVLDVKIVEEAYLIQVNLGLP